MYKRQSLSNEVHKGKEVYGKQRYGRKRLQTQFAEASDENPHDIADVVEHVHDSAEKSVDEDGIDAALPRRCLLYTSRPILEEVGNAKCLNMILLASAVATGALDLSLDELKGAVRACVKPRFAEMLSLIHI